MASRSSSELENAEILVLSLLISTDILSTLSEEDNGDVDKWRSRG